MPLVVGYYRCRNPRHLWWVSTNISGSLLSAWSRSEYSLVLCLLAGLLPSWFIQLHFPPVLFNHNVCQEQHTNFPFGYLLTAFTPISV